MKTYRRSEKKDVQQKTDVHYYTMKNINQTLINKHPS